MTVASGGVSPLIFGSIRGPTSPARPKRAGADSPNEHTAAEPLVGVELVLHRRRPGVADVLPKVTGDVAAGPGPVADHQVGPAVPVQVLGRHPDPATVLDVPTEEVC